MMRMPSSGDIQALGGFLDLGAVAQQDGDAQPQRMELPRGLQHARFRAFGKDNPLGMPLQFFDDTADKTHGIR